MRRTKQILYLKTIPVNMKTSLLNLLFCVLIYGVNNADAKVAHIIGPGTEDAEAGEFPYIVYIQQKSEFAVPKLLTTGILIRPAVVLTLAWNYVYVRPEDIEVVFGTHNRSDESDVYGYREVIDVAEIVLHPDYTQDYESPNSAKDLSLIRLVSSPVGVVCSSGKKVSRTCPRQPRKIYLYGPTWPTVNPQASVSSREQNNFTGNIKKDKTLSDESRLVAKINEFEKNDKVEVIYPTIQQKYNVSVLTPSKARKILKEENFAGKDFWLVSKNEDLTGACVGDGGNPLLCSREYGGPYKVFGLASFGDPKCESGVTGWTRLSQHYGWIKKTSRKLQKNASPSKRVKCLHE